MNIALMMELINDACLQFSLNSPQIFVSCAFFSLLLSRQFFRCVVSRLINHHDNPMQPLRKYGGAAFCPYLYVSIEKVLVPQAHDDIFFTILSSNKEEYVFTNFFQFIPY